ncbi:hypothetical protein HZB78_05495 [Candidatus Collierbacteria bacterium]|nr:hypothetical protein [Candidatus Collierbacteria bacterium]
MTKLKPRAKNIDPKHEHWNTQCPDCGEWFVGQHGLSRHIAWNSIKYRIESKPRAGGEWEKMLRKKRFYGEYGGIKFTYFASEELIRAISSILSRREQEVADEICDLIDGIELGYKDTSLEEWKAFKHIRNAIRDKYAVQKVRGGK